jgi:hypothetical protein
MLRQAYNAAFEQGRQAYLADEVTYDNPYDAMAQSGDAIRPARLGCRYRGGDGRLGLGAPTENVLKNRLRHPLCPRHFQRGPAPYRKRLSWNGGFAHETSGTLSQS